MKPEDFFKRFKELQSADLKIAKSKNHDYAGTKDALDNFREFGFQGVVVRMNDKMKRLINFTRSGILKVGDESILDTLSDLRVYATIAEIIFMDETDTPTHVCPFCGYAPKPGTVIDGHEDADKNTVWQCPKCKKWSREDNWKNYE